MKHQQQNVQQLLDEEENVENVGRSTKENAGIESEDEYEERNEEERKPKVQSHENIRKKKNVQRNRQNSCIL